MRTRNLVPVVFLALIASSGAIHAHCQVPCGIFDDAARFTLMFEDVTTIEKAMVQINGLSAEESPNWNQLFRWVATKEQHADKLSATVHTYFLAQRVKPADPGDEVAWAKYMQELRFLHGLVIHAMKAKQTTDLEQVEHLRQLLGEFKASYLGEHQHQD